MARLVADQRVDDAARARIRERAMRASATTDATFAGVVVDLAESGEPVSVRTTGGRTLTGRVVAATRDAIALEASDATTYIPLRSVAALRTPVRRIDAPSGARRLPEVSLAALLAGIAPERPTVACSIAGDPAVWRGELRAVGVDVVTVRLAADPPTTAYIPLAQMSELTVFASG